MAELKLCKKCGSPHKGRKDECESCAKITNAERKIAESRIRYTSDNEDDWVECPICGLRAGSIITRHMPSAHGISGEEFRSMYPGLRGVSESWRKTHSDISKSEKNPFRNHGGKYSPNSKKFVGYENYNEDELQEALSNNRKKMSDSLLTNNNLNSRISYWTARGYSEEEAASLVSERQRTFTLDLCIERYGAPFGILVWEKRQSKWQETLNSKSPEEKIAIGKRKMKGRTTSSKIEIEIADRLEGAGYNVDRQFGIISDNGRAKLYDIRVGDKIIEINGEYWHADPVRYKRGDKVKIGKTQVPVEVIWAKDDYKRELAETSGYSILTVWEWETKDIDACLSKCIKFLEGEHRGR